MDTARLDDCCRCSNDCEEDRVEEAAAVATAAAEDDAINGVVSPLL